MYGAKDGGPPQQGVPVAYGYDQGGAGYGQQQPTPTGTFGSNASGPGGAAYGAPVGYPTAAHAVPPQPQHTQGGMYGGGYNPGGYQHTPQQQPLNPLGQPVPVEGVPLYGEAAAGGRFVVQGWQDVWATVLFWAQFVAVLAFGFVAFSKHGTFGTDTDYSPADSPEDRSEPIANMWSWALLACGISIGTGLLLLIVMRAHAYKFIVASNLIMTAYMLGLAIWMVSKGASTFSVIFLILALFNVLWLYLVRKRLHFAGVMLECSTRVIWRYTGTLWGALSSIVVLVGYLLIYAAAVHDWIPKQERMADGSTELVGGKSGLLLLFIVFLFWTANTVTGVVHTTVAGTVATWYFMQNNMPSNPTCASFRRSMTTSFGSVAFGSLIVAIIQTIRVIAMAGRGHNNEFVQCCIECILRCLENIMRYFNKYAFTQVAIYGKSYIQAAKATWALIKSGAGIDALINDCLIDPALTISMLFGAVNTGLVCGLAAGDLATGIACGVVGLVILSTMMTVIDSAVATIFVCYCENPGSLAIANPDLHTAISETARQW